MAPNNSSSCPPSPFAVWPHQLNSLAQPVYGPPILVVHRDHHARSTVVVTRANQGRCVRTEEAAAECVSEDALQHLKTYKYSAVDKSPFSYYILRPYVRPTQPSPCLGGRVMDGSAALFAELQELVLNTNS